MFNIYIYFYIILIFSKEIFTFKNAKNWEKKKKISKKNLKENWMQKLEIKSKMLIEIKKIMKD